MKTLAVFGAGGHGKVVADAALCSGWDSIIFYDDNWPKKAELGPWSVQGDEDLFLSQAKQFTGVIIAIGDNMIRMEKIALLQKLNISLATIVHPSSVISPHAAVAEGSVIFANAVLNPGCSIGVGTIVNTGAILEHDCQLGNAVHVSSGAILAGGVEVGDLSWIGAGASVRHNIKIGSKVTVGAGAAVVNNIPDNCTVIGVPARNLLSERTC
ncbi:acetyltransferase [Legionella anisa]|uniref:Acetyltransferase n=1 Tax=Legionella anisa TaxID=28082 RepID=A0AAX0WYF7_9GAMM|nr:acetyltransferase [Legionella anisa]AWN72932.1 acetyltransferase [Legionella anisa]KTC70614.1 chloramphenicol acetyltransferase [Legionella anisa]MBN5937203.1 acetyltransferase [Legionella anisa]MCW8423743.1 acetyltransferase [Legionella anisa]MCW8447263.1 acetyltransferase [Legionella anisa]